MDPLDSPGVGSCMDWLVAGLADDKGASKSVFGGIEVEAEMRTGRSK